MIRLTDYLYDLIQNSIEAGASEITLDIQMKDNLSISIIDNGKGMDIDTLNRVRSFQFTSRKKRKVGLGLSLIHDLTNQTEGYFHIDSKPNLGTHLSLGFNQKHLDFPLFGDLSELVCDLYMHQDIKQFTLIYNDLKLDFQSLGFLDEIKSYQKRKALKEILDVALQKESYENN